MDDEYSNIRPEDLVDEEQVIVIEPKADYKATTFSPPMALSSEKEPLLDKDTLPLVSTT